MVRPRLFDDEELLCSLRQSFLALGPGATTQELATRAAVSEGTLFKRFGTKQRMFALAMRLPALDGPWFEQMLERAGQGPLGGHLADIASGLAGYLEELFPRLLCAFGHPLQPEHIRTIFGDDAAPTLIILRRLTALFELEIAAGRVRPLPAGHLAELFIGGIQHHVHATVLFGNHGGTNEDLGDFARGLAATVHAIVQAPGLDENT